ncbi:MAG: SDR family oxidoreductase [Christensenellales bacterium]|jgi:2-deoxy-D-gluconate 3-dehydrogenase
MVSNLFDVTGKCAIVTGGAQGLSLGMAEALLEAGCKVVMMDIQKDKLEAAVAENVAKGYEAFAVSGDLTKPEEIDRMFGEAMQFLGGRLDVLIPAAGVQRRHPPELFPREDWELVINVNLNHVWFMCQKAVQVMIKQPTGGKIIIISSLLAFFGGTCIPAYTATKGAVAQLAKSLASDCADKNININAIAPGYMETEMTANMTDARKAEVSARIPAGRWGTTQDMKGPVLFLASSASDYINGAILPVDGGYLVK